MTPSTRRLPRKSSRTSTQAIAVPMIAFTNAAAADMSSVSSRAETAWRPVAASQNALQPSAKAWEVSAASGSSTMTESHSRATPPPRAPPMLTPPRRANARRGSRSAAVSAIGGDAELLLDVGDDGVLRVEELLVDLVPAAEVVDREEARRGRELLLVDERGENRAIALGGEDLLRLRRLHELEEGRGLLHVLALRHDRGRVLDEQRAARRDVVDLLALADRGERLVLVGDEHVALAADEGLQRLAARLGLHGHVVVQLLQVVAGLGRRLPRLARRAVGAHHVPLGGARGEHVRRDDLDPRLEEVVPGLDVLGVALADDEGHDGVRHEPLRRVLVPVLRDEALVDELAHVGREREPDVVGVQAGDDRAGLVARGAVGLRERGALAVGGLLERGDERGVGLLGRRVGDEGDLRAGAAAGRGAAAGVVAAARDEHREERDREGGMEESSEHGEAHHIANPDRRSQVTDRVYP